MNEIFEPIVGFDNYVINREGVVFNEKCSSNYPC